MRFLFLGSLEMRDHDGRGIRINSTRRRQLLALFLLRANHAISVTQLVDGIWPEDPPHSARANIKTYVSALRRDVGRAGATIETVPRGYRLHVHPDAVDGLLFDEHVQAGARAALRGDLTAQVEHLQQATSLWRGEALQDLPSARGPLHDAATRWHEKRMAAIQDLTAALLELGRYAEAIDHLRVALSDEPLRERLWVLLMLALYRDGRRAESLSACLDFRTMPPAGSQSRQRSKNVRYAASRCRRLIPCRAKCSNAPMDTMASYCASSWPAQFSTRTSYRSSAHAAMLSRCAGLSVRPTTRRTPRTSTRCRSMLPQPHPMSSTVPAPAARAPVAM